MSNICDLFHEYFDYKDGHLYWKKKSARWTVIGSPVATYEMPNGYLRVGLKGKRYYLHRVIYTMFHGEMPTNVDHIDGNRSNNSKENLRAATKQNNNMNRMKSSGTSSKYKGVHWRKDRERWTAQIKVDGKCIRLGCFDSEEDAALAYNRKAVELFKEFAWLNDVSS